MNIPGYDRWATAGPPETDHFKECPANPDNEWPDDKEPRCICADLDSQAKEDHAEYLQGLEDDGY